MTDLIKRVRMLKKDRGKIYPLSIIYSAASSMFSMKIPYPRVGSFTRT